ncbi:UDP-glucuronosyltransferase 2C1 isoform X2 [Drosophila erecta]|uniref:UDP-glucuronosyltransferase 2C1 isoform X2 n=1 Tax=Drosophila erecta TaxID=7220 RepID=UPI000F06B3D0|nr:UDP-glucuronosyltransferase 2C1 isoform X2 [Drosophila erecta]
MRLEFSWLAVALCVILQQDLCQDSVQAASILGIFSYHFSSHNLVVRPLARALVKRGHNVTLITPVGMPSDIEGVRHIRVPKLNQQMIECDQMMDFFGSKWIAGWLAVTMLYNMSLDILSDEGVQRMLKDKSERFDLVMLEPSALEALYGIVEFYNATLMGFSGGNVNWSTEEVAGNFAPSINDPISSLGYSRGNSLLSKIYNWVHITEEKLLTHLIVRPSQLHIFKKFFGYSEQTFYYMRKRYSVILVNNHFSMGRVRSNVPNIIEVGGLHLTEPPEPCDAKLQRFMDDAEHGVIYFSMGQEILVQFLPEDMQQNLMKSLVQFKQRVVWKTELYSMPNKADNIYVIEQPPQRAVLAHPNTRLFITNGGLLSVMEAVYSGVPILGLPVFFDQFINLRNVNLRGMAEVLDANEMSLEMLTSTIRELLENPKYTLKARKMSQSFRDRPMSPLDTAVWWTEYALRNGDASHMRLKTEDVPLYYQWDWLILLAARFGIVFGSVIYLFYKVFQKTRAGPRPLQDREAAFQHLILLAPRWQAQ